MNKTAIKNFAISARKKLIAMAKDRAGIIGITADQIAEPAQSGNGFAVYPTHFGTQTTLTGGELSQRASLVRQIQEKSYDSVMEEVAYTWFNRLIAVRFMEVNDYLPTRVRGLSSEREGKQEPDLVTEAPNVDLGFTDAEKEEIYALKDDPRKSGELFKKLFIKQCNALGEILPNLFEKTADYTELLLDIAWDKEDGVVRELLSIDEADFREAVEIIGWMYQYYNDERKNEVINIYKGTVKKEDIPAATQLFTTDWVVRYMVDNSLGRYWIERHPESKLAEKLEFFVTPKDGHITRVDESLDPTGLTFFDPCMGSGHILVYAFDVLMEIYRECGYSDRDAAGSILQNNLFGLDIDNRAYQLAYFALMMRARSYDRRAFTRGIIPQVFAPKGYADGEEYGSLLTAAEPGIKPELPKEFTLFDTEEHYKKTLNTWNFRRLLAQKYCVVCTNPPYLNKMNAKLKDYVLANYKDYSGDLFSVFMYHNFSFCKQGGYSAFMTPFVWMFIKTYEKLREYIIQNKSIATLVQMEYSAFEEATVPICSFVLKNEKSAEKGLYFKLSDFKGGMDVQKQKVLEAIADKECSYFYESAQDNFSKIPGSPLAYWLHNFEIFNFKSLSAVLESGGRIKTHDNNRYVRNWWELKSNDVQWCPYANGGDFRKWYGNHTDVVNWSYGARKFYAEHSGLCNEKYWNKEGITWGAITSSKNSYRIKLNDFLFSSASPTVFDSKYECNKSALAFLNSKVSEYLSGIINPTLNQNVNDTLRLPYCGGTAVAEKIVSECITQSKSDWDSYGTSWDFKRHPLLLYSYQNDYGLVDGKNINQAPSLLWDDELQIFEQEKNEPKHPQKCELQNCYTAWKKACEHRFQQLKSNEEELNRIFIDIYGLQDELTPEEEAKDVTVHRVFDSKDDVSESMKGSAYVRTMRDEIVSLVSYAVGCMFGRYSIYKDGLIYAGGDFAEQYEYHKNTNGDLSQCTYGELAAYTHAQLQEPYYFLKGQAVAPIKGWKVDADNVLPITDDAYFPDDIVTRFCDFVKTAYGADTLEENLDFVAKALGNKGASSREVIRNYFLNDFYKDHCKTYQKRPIYWLFDSGKQDGFKALIYLHRYDPDTVGRVRADYLHKQQGFLENAIANCDYTMQTSSNAHDKADATKKKDKLVKQLSETRTYDQALAHIALQRIPLDLDDGVKVNYEKFQNIEVAREGQKALKIDLLAKI